MHSLQSIQQLPVPKGMDLKSFAKRLITSPPLVAYVVMFILAVANIDTPQVILTLIEPMARPTHLLPC